MEFSRVYDLVKAILVSDKQARNSDRIMYYDYLTWYYGDKMMNITLAEALEDPDKYNLPNYDTITRARRKVQADHEELRSDKAIEKMRRKREEDFVKFAVGKDGHEG